MCFGLRHAINVLVLPFIDYTSLSKTVSSFVKCDFYYPFLYRVVIRTVRDKALRRGLAHRKKSINVDSTFNNLKVEIQKK